MTGLTFPLNPLNAVRKTRNTTTGQDELSTADKAVMVNSGGSAGSANAVLRKIKATMAAADRDNSVLYPPLIAAPAWSATTYWAGQVISNAGHDYMAMQDNAASSAAPTGTSTQVVTDGSQQWAYYGENGIVDAREGSMTLAWGTFASWSGTLSKRVAASVAAQNVNFFFSGGKPTAKSDGIDLPALTITPSTSTMSDITKNCATGCIDLETDADQIAFGSTNFGPNAWYKFSAEVNNRAVYKGSVNSGGAAAGGWVFTFPTAKVRRIRMWHTTDLYFPGVYVKPRHSVWATKNPNRWRMVINGCSHESTLTAQLANGGYWNQVARLLGCDDYIEVSKYGTGFVNNGTSTTTYNQRVADVISFAPDVYVVGDPFNDAASNGATLQAAILAHIQAVRAGLPNTIILLTGVNAQATGETSPGNAKYISETDTLAAFNTYKAANPSDSLIYFLPCITDPAGSMMFGGSNILSAPSGTSNSVIYTSPDGTHAWQGGLDYQARWWATRLRGLFNSMFATFGI